MTWPSFLLGFASVYVLFIVAWGVLLAVTLWRDHVDKRITAECKRLKKLTSHPHSRFLAKLAGVDPIEGDWRVTGIIGPGMRYSFMTHSQTIPLERFPSADQKILSEVIRAM